MKKLKATIPNGGAPLGAFPVLRELFDEETKNAIEALLFSVVDGDTQGVVLKGCAVTGIVSDYDIAEGYVYLDGEVMFYPGVTGLSAVNYVKAATAAEESDVFADGVSKAYIDVQNAVEFTTTGGGAGTQYITFNFDTPGQTLSRLVSGAKYTDDSAVVTEVKIRTEVIEIGDWDMDADSTVLINHGAADNETVSVIGTTIRPDSGVAFLDGPLERVDSSTIIQGGVDSVGATQITLRRLASGDFDSTNFNQTSWNRGWITIIVRS